MPRPKDQLFGRNLTRIPAPQTPDFTTFDGRADAAVAEMIAKQQAAADYNRRRQEEKLRASQLRAGVLAAQQERNKARQGVHPAEIWGAEGVEACDAFLTRMQRKGITGELLPFPPEKRSAILPFLKKRETIEAFSVAFADRPRAVPLDPTHFWSALSPKSEAVQYAVYLCRDGLLRIKGDSGLEYPPVQEDGRRTRIYCGHSYTVTEPNPHYNSDNTSGDRETIEVPRFREEPIGKVLEALASRLELHTQSS